LHVAAETTEAARRAATRTTRKENLIVVCVYVRKRKRKGKRKGCLFAVLRWNDTARRTRGEK